MGRYGSLGHFASGLVRGMLIPAIAAMSLAACSAKPDNLVSIINSDRRMIFSREFRPVDKIDVIVDSPLQDRLYAVVLGTDKGGDAVFMSPQGCLVSQSGNAVSQVVSGGLVKDDNFPTDYSLAVGIDMQCVRDRLTQGQEENVYIVYVPEGKSPLLLTVQLGGYDQISPTETPTKSALPSSPAPSAYIYDSLSGLPVRCVGGALFYYSARFEPAYIDGRIMPDLNHPLENGLSVGCLTDSGKLAAYLLRSEGKGDIEVHPGEDTFGTSILIPGDIQVPGSRYYDFDSRVNISPGYQPYFPIASSLPPLEPLEHNSVR